MNSPATQALAFPPARRRGYGARGYNAGRRWLGFLALGALFFSFLSTASPASSRAQEAAADDASYALFVSGIT